MSASMPGHIEDIQQPAEELSLVVGVHHVVSVGCSGIVTDSGFTVQKSGQNQCCIVFLGGDASFWFYRIKNEYKTTIKHIGPIWMGRGTLPSIFACVPPSKFTPESYPGMQPGWSGKEEAVIVCFFLNDTTPYVLTVKKLNKMACLPKKSIPDPYPIQGVCMDFRGALCHKNGFSPNSYQTHVDGNKSLITTSLALWKTFQKL